jgi:hypothetical protein
MNVAHLVCLCVGTLTCMRASMCVGLFRLRGDSGATLRRQLWICGVRARRCWCSLFRGCQPMVGAKPIVSGPARLACCACCSAVTCLAVTPADVSLCRWVHWQVVAVGVLAFAFAEDVRQGLGRDWCGAGSDGAPSPGSPGSPVTAGTGSSTPQGPQHSAVAWWRRAWLPPVLQHAVASTAGSMWTGACRVRGAC